MKPLATLLLLCASFYAGTHYVVVPRLDQCSSSPAKATNRKAAKATANPRPATGSKEALDLGF